MIWIPVSKEEEEELARDHNITEGVYPAIGCATLYAAPVSEDRADTTLPFIRENGVLKMGIKDEEFFGSYDSVDEIGGIEILSYRDFTGNEEDKGVAYIALFAKM